MEVPLLAFLTVISLKCIDGFQSTTPECQSSTYGKEFIFGIIQPASLDILTHSIELQIFSKQSGTIHLDAPYLQIHKTYNVSAGTPLNIQIPTGQERIGTFQQHRGIRIMSSSDISVMLSQAAKGFFQISYFILPLQVLGNKYVAASYTSHIYYKGRVMVVATENNSSITVDVNGKIIQKTLNSMEVYQFESETHTDISGTIIQSNKRVAVFTACLSSITSIVYGNYPVFSAQMTPAVAWSKRFIVVSNRQYILRIFAETKDINLSFRNESHTLNITQNDITDYIFETEPLTVVTDRPVQVVQYMKAMIIVPGVEHYANNYTFIMPYKDDSVSSFIDITIPSDKVDGLLYNGVSFHKSLQHVPAPFSEYDVVTFNTTSELIHSITITDNSVKFGLMFDRLRSEYFSGIGFYVGSTIADCDMHTSETTVSTTQFPSTVPTSVIETSAMSTTQFPLTVTTNFIETSTVVEDGPFCFSCDGMSHLQYCDRVIKCHRNEKCFVKRYNDHRGQFVFRSGCMLTKNCQLRNSIAKTSINDCIECCNGNVCNSNGCSDDGLPSIDKRGPVCFDCEHVGSPDECQGVTLCDIGQKCMIVEFKWGSGFHYKLGCGSQMCDPIVKRNLHDLDARSVSVCHECCDEDICNRDCSTAMSSQGSPVIVG